MWQKFLQIFKVKELRNKILFVLAVFIIFRLVANIPVPGIDAARLKSFFEGNQLFGLLNMFTGGAMSNLSIAMLGMGPYITGTIIMQLLTMIFPQLKEMYYEEGAAGRAKFNRYSRYLTVPLAVIQSYGFLRLLMSQGVVPPLGILDLARNVLLITTGSMILVWLGELISEQKIGNGISLIIFAGILSSLPSVVRQLYFDYQTGIMEVDVVIAFIAVAILVIAGVVFIQEGERKIPVAYAKRVRGTKMYGGVSSYLPIKVNQAGVIPIIFAISILLFPQFIAQAAAIISQDLAVKLNSIISRFLDPNINPYFFSLFYFILVVVFTYFYTAVTFDPKEISKNLQRAGGFIAGIRPGDSTAVFLSKIINRITLGGAIFLGLIAILPNIMGVITSNNVLVIGGTSLLIAVAVALEVMRQVNSQLVMREYEGF